jgi:hypothetical protein
MKKEKIILSAFAVLATVASALAYTHSKKGQIRTLCTKTAGVCHSAPCTRIGNGPQCPVVTYYTCISPCHKTLGMTAFAPGP